MSCGYNYGIKYIEVKNTENNSRYLRVLHLIAYHRPTSCNCNLQAQAVTVPLVTITYLRIVITA